MHLASKHEGYFKLAVRGSVTSVTSVTNVEGVNGTVTNVAEVTVTPYTYPQKYTKMFAKVREGRARSFG